MLIAFVLIIAVAVLPAVALWVWRLQIRVLGALVPGADLDDIAALADLPVSRTLGAGPPAVAGPAVRLLGVTRGAAAVLVAYRQVEGPDCAAADQAVSTLLLRLDDGGMWEVAVLERWRAAGTPLVVATDLSAGEVAIQRPVTRLTVTLPLVA